MEVEGMINGRKITAIIDTGADLSSISAELTAQLQLTPQLHELPITCQGITGETEKLDKWVALNFELGSLTVRHSFNVHKNPPVPLIIGRDFMHTNNVEIDRQGRELWIEDEAVPFRRPSDAALTAFAAHTPDNNSTDEHETPVTAEKEIKIVASYTSIVIQPHQERMVRVSLPPDLQPDVSYCVEGTLQAERRGLLIAATLAQGNCKQLFTRVFNPTACSISLTAAFPLCSVQPVRVMDGTDWSEGSCMQLADLSQEASASPSPHKSSVANEDEFEDEDSLAHFRRDDLTCKKDSPSAATGSTSEVKAAQTPAFPQEEFVKLIGDALPSDIPDHDRQRLVEVLYGFKDVFSRDKNDLGKTHVMKHSIDVEEGTRPIAIPPRRYSPKERQIMKDVVQKYKEIGIVRDSSSPWACPVVLVIKKDGSIRFCCDWRKLNAVTKKDRMPLPRVDDTIDRLSNSQFFTKLDFTSGYFQMELDEDAIEKSAFVTPDGHFEWTVMGMGLCNAPASFVRMVSKVLGSLLWTNCLAYLDDVVIFSPDYDKHLLDIEQVLTKLRNAGLKLKPSKCSFAQRRIEFLGFIITPDGVLPDPKKVEKMVKFPCPRDVKSVQRFLGLINYYRKFIPSFAETAQPLYQLLRKGQRWKWLPAHQKAFEKLKHLMTLEPVLAFPDFSKPFIVSTDASKVALGCILKQLDSDGNERVIQYGSKTLNAAQRNYSTIERECLAIKYATVLFRPYLHGNRFIVFTDHKPLVGLMRSETPNVRLTKWRTDFADFDLQILYRPGKDNPDADALSRITENFVNRSSSSHTHFQTSLLLPATLSIIADYRLLTRHRRRRQYLRRGSPVHQKRATSAFGYAWNSNSRTGRSSYDSSNADLPIDCIVRTQDCTTASAARQTPDSDSCTADLTTAARRTPDLDSCTADLMTVSLNPDMVLSKPSSHPKQDSCTADDDDGAAVSVELFCQPRESDRKSDHIQAKDEITVALDLAESPESPSPPSSGSLDPTLPVNTSDLIDLQRSESWSRRIIQLLEEQLPTAASRKLRRKTNLFQLIDGVLYRKVSGELLSRLALVVPKSLRADLLFRAHDESYSGHMGVEKTYRRIRSHYYWPGLWKDVKAYVLSCPRCGLNSTNRQPLYGSLQSIPPANSFFQRLSIDKVGAVQNATSGNAYFFVAVDNCTRYKFAAAYPRGRATDAAHFLLHYCILRHCPPQEVVTDNGSEFSGPEFVSLLKAFHIRHIFTSPRHPQSNGMVERGNGSVSESIRHLIDEGHNNWDELLPHVVYALNTAVHDVTGFSPFFLVHGFEAYAAHLLPVESRTSAPTILSIEDAQDARNVALRVATERTRARQERSAERYNARHQGDLSAFFPGRRVYVETRTTRPGYSQRLNPRYTGPSTVIGPADSPVVMWIEDQDGTQYQVHVKRLRLCHERPADLIPTLQHRHVPAAQGPSRRKPSRSNRRRKSQSQPAPTSAPAASNDSERTAVTDPTSAPRRRGRPRKTPLAHTPHPQPPDVPTTAQTQTPTPENPAVGTEAVPRKKRGRPRKTAAPQSASSPEFAVPTPHPPIPAATRVLRSNSKKQIGTTSHCCSCSCHLIRRIR